jgi:hypothetical protein
LNGKTGIAKTFSAVASVKDIIPRFFRGSGEKSIRKKLPIKFPVKLAGRFHKKRGAPREAPRHPNHRSQL